MAVSEPFRVAEFFVTAAAGLVVTAGGLATWIVKALVVVPARLSVTRTVNVESPPVVGVPVIAPFALRVRPAGRAPVTIAQV